MKNKVLFVFCYKTELFSAAWILIWSLWIRHSQIKLQETDVKVFTNVNKDQMWGERTPPRYSRHLETSGCLLKSFSPVRSWTFTSEDDWSQLHRTERTSHPQSPVLGPVAPAAESGLHVLSEHPTARGKRQIKEWDGSPSRNSSSARDASSEKHRLSSEVEALKKKKTLLTQFFSGVF